MASPSPKLPSKRTPALEVQGEGLKLENENRAIGTKGCTQREDLDWGRGRERVTRGPLPGSQISGQQEHGWAVEQGGSRTLSS